MWLDKGFVDLVPSCQSVVPWYTRVFFSITLSEKKNFGRATGGDTRAS